MTLTCNTVTECWCANKCGNYFLVLIMLPFMILIDIIYFAFHIITYPLVCILSPIWVTLLYPLFSKKFHHLTNNSRGCIKFVLTNEYNSSDRCNLQFYIHFFVDLILNLEVLV